jgi:DNA topoisomerase VI subunit B
MISSAAGPRLDRATFATSRLIEFCSEKELIAQTGAAVTDWPVYVAKELVDNALDACEEAEIAPEITIEVDNGKVIVGDNGPGIRVETVKQLLDFSVRVSSREAYVSPTRGAQGNALKTILAMPFALDGSMGKVLIEAREIEHAIDFRVDPVRQTPCLTHACSGSSVKNGTRITVYWPDSASSNLARARVRFLQIADDFTWVNSHLTLRALWDGTKAIDVAATNPTWSKWRPSYPTSPHWYTPARLERLMAAYVGLDQDNGSRDRTAREFISEFRGLSGSAKQKLVLAEVDASRMALSAFFANDEVDRLRIGRLLAAMKKVSRRVKPIDLGVIGEGHLRTRLVAAGAHARTIRYKREVVQGDLPVMIEAAFGYCPHGAQRRLVTGVNWSPGINNPFRTLGRYGESLDTLLSQQRAGDPDEPITLVIHMACPRVDYTDRGKSALVIAGELSADEAKAYDGDADGNNDEDYDE